MSTRDEDILKMIIAEIPELASRISSKYYNSSIFLEACEDYVVCLKSIKRLEAKNKEGIDKEIIELKALLTELKEEILSKMKKEDHV